MLKIICCSIVLLVAFFGQAQGSTCTDNGGSCVDWTNANCPAGIQSGWCPGGDNIKCCLNCNAACQLNENSYNDAACTSIGGECKESSNYCDGGYKSGYCGGPSDRQCCVEMDCTLVEYSSFRVRGYNGLIVEVEPGFVDSMDKIDDYAASCGVYVYVTHAFRYEGQSLGGTVVAPASNSNHLVGHAIDFNLDTGSGWCNGDCLSAENNADARCFTDKINSDGSLRWGESFDDPVHVDDNLYYSNTNLWNSLYYDLQGACT